jgi:hypothetical protein
VKNYFVFDALQKYRTLKETISTNIANLKEVSYIYISAAKLIILPIVNPILDKKLKFKFVLMKLRCVGYLGGYMER